MTERDAALAALADLQRRFGDLLRTPLGRGGKTLQADVARYDAALCAAVDADGAPAAARLSVYHRQYWFRLFGALQHEFPLVTALVGAWAFNGLASAYLAAHPPRLRALARVGDDLPAFVGVAVARRPAQAAVAVAVDAATEAAGRTGPPSPRVAATPATADACFVSENRTNAPGGHDGADDGLGGCDVPGEVLAQAVAIDDAFRRAFAAPAHAPLQLGPNDVERLPWGRLVSSPAATVVVENHPLMTLRDALPPTPSARPVALPPPHPGGPRAWLVCRSGHGHRALPLVPRHARLLRLLATHSLTDALAHLEAECPPGERDGLAAAAQRWLAEGMALGLWTAVETAS